MNGQYRFQVLIFRVSQSFLEEQVRYFVSSVCRFALVDVFLSANVNKVLLEEMVKGIRYLLFPDCNTENAQWKKRVYLLIEWLNWPTRCILSFVGWICRLWKMIALKEANRKRERAWVRIYLHWRAWWFLLVVLRYKMAGTFMSGIVELGEIQFLM